MTMPLFFVGEPDVLIGLISIAIEAGFPLNEGNLSKKTPGKLVLFLSQSLPSFKNCSNLSSVVIFNDHHDSIRMEIYILNSKKIFSRTLDHIAFRSILYSIPNNVSF